MPRDVFLGAVSIIRLPASYYPYFCSSMLNLVRWLRDVLRYINQNFFKCTLWLVIGSVIINGVNAVLVLFCQTSDLIAALRA